MPMAVPSGRRLRTRSRVGNCTPAPTSRPVFVNGKEGDGLPFPATLAVLERGQERYNVYCTPCHSRVGNGVGMIVQRGYAPAGDLHSERLAKAPLGHFFNVISNGYGAMPDYSAQVVPADRWAIAAYIRALQLSQHAQPSDVASNAHVQPLAEIEKDKGFPANFAAEWTLPPTAVKGGPNNKLYVFPEPGETPSSAATSKASKSTAATAAKPTPSVAATAPKQ